MSVEITLGKGGHPRYKEVSDYGKLATQYSNTDINLAITYLEKIWEINNTTDYDADLAQLVRLPKFLQQAGRLDEALVRCDELLNSSVDRMTTRWSFHRFGSIIKDYFLALDRAGIYKCLAIIYKREKNKEKSAYYKELESQQLAIADSLNQEIKILEDKELQIYQDWKDGKRNNF
ncbi:MULTISPECIES: hypothetical protein [unclassified Moraxella]|uniref:hypothetical protein n=1 Tax=unclassified Moraxella TaxID=2685852 RepID=UPI003AF45777